MDERKLKILNSIIKSYSESKEPVGSRTLSKDENIGVSAATIRNEMSDLEELGYLIKVHSSSGRIPSAQGYRLYVEALLKDKIPFAGKTNQLIDTRSLEESSEFENVVENAAKILSAITNYTALALLPKNDDLSLSYINVVYLSPKDLAILYIYNTKMIKHDVVSLRSPTSRDKVDLVNSIFNSVLLGKHPNEILEILGSDMMEVLRRQNHVLDFLIAKVRKAMEGMLRSRLVYEGLANIYKYHEASIDENQTLIDRIVNENLLAEAFGQDMDARLQISIAEDIGVEEFDDFTLITTSFANSEGLRGKIGILGPVAMEYDKVIADILLVNKYISANIDKRR